MQTPKNMNSHNPRSSDAHKHTRTHCLAHAHSMVQKPTFTTTRTETARLRHQRLLRNIPSHQGSCPEGDQELAEGLLDEILIHPERQDEAREDLGNPEEVVRYTIYM